MNVHAHVVGMIMLCFVEPYTAETCSKMKTMGSNLLHDTQDLSQCPCSQGRSSPLSCPFRTAPAQITYLFRR